MKNKILRRLILYFVATFAIFAFVIGIIFTVLFSEHNLGAHRSELTHRAINISKSLSGMLDTGKPGYERCLCEIGHYLGLIENITISDMWVIDEHFGEITFGCIYLLELSWDLPEHTEHIIGEAFRGNTALCHTSFPAFFDNPYIIVATPIVLPNDDIAGVLLMRTQVHGINEVTRNAIMLLFYSMLAAVAISVGVAIMLSSRFTLPLNKMKAAALEIGGGDYSVRTGVKQFDEIGELAAVMDSMTEKLAITADESRRLEKLRQDFVANISHELRTPITVIRGSLEALCDGIISEPAKITEYHEQMLRECEYLGRLVSDLLDLSRLQNMDFAIEMQDVNLQDVLEDVLISMTGLAAEKNIKLDFSCDKDEFKVTGDYSRLRQMLIILLDNAIKFSPVGGIVYVTLSKKGALAHVSIADQGSGISPADFDHIFERFYKQQSGSNKSGTGLGLAIAKEIAERHGAILQAGNLPNKGAEFTFSIKL